MSLFRLLFFCSCLAAASGCGSCGGNNGTGGPTDSGTEEDADQPSTDAGEDAPSNFDIATSDTRSPHDAGTDTTAGEDFTLTATEPNFRVRIGGSATMRLDVERAGGFSADIIVAVDGLPTAVGADPVTVPIASNQAAVTVEALATAEHAGPFPITVRGVADDDPSIASEVILDAYVAGAPGEADTSFSSDGMLSYMLSPDFDDARAMALDASGRPVVAGTTLGGGDGNAYIVRFLTDGTIDDTFGDEGLVEGFGPSSSISRLAMDGDAMVVLAQSDAASGFLRRLDETGSVDSDFGTGGDTLIPGGQQEFIRWGTSYVYANNTGLGMVDAQGDPVTTFAPPDPLPLFVTSIAASGAQLLVGGYDTSLEDFVLMRLEPDGTLDDSFGTDGLARVVTGMGESPWDLRAISVEPDGSGLALAEARWGSDLQSRVFVFAFDADGQPDVAVGPGGILGVHAEGTASDAFRQTNGKIVVLYSERMGPMVGDGKVARFDPDGAPDTTFGTNGVVDISPPYTAAADYDPAGDRLVFLRRNFDLELFRIWL